MGKHETNCKDAITLTPKERQSYDIFFRGEDKDTRPADVWWRAVEENIERKRRGYKFETLA